MEDAVNKLLWISHQYMFFFRQFPCLYERVCHYLQRGQFPLQSRDMVTWSCMVEKQDGVTIPAVSDDFSMTPQCKNRHVKQHDLITQG